MDDRIKILTQDGSPSLFHPNLDETYHSRHGALQESMLVFVEMGLKFVLEKQKDEISVLEMGFGTGLNAFLTLLACKNLNTIINYQSLEKYPLSREEAEELDYSDSVSQHFGKDSSKNDLQSLYKQIHQSKWEVWEKINKNFYLKKQNQDLETTKFEENKFDLVFFDAFSPRVQPNLWTEDIFRKIFEAMKKDSVLVTYCAKGEVRRNLQNVGFVCERLQGPPGKREMLRANKLGV